MHWCLLSQLLLLLVITVLEYLSEVYPSLLHKWDCDSPIMVCRTESNCALGNVNLPIGLVLFRCEGPNQIIYLLYLLLEPFHHVLWGYLELVD